MTLRQIIKFCMPNLWPHLTFSMALIFVGCAPAVDQLPVAIPLCGVLKDLVPKVQSYTSAGAQVELVLAVAQAFNNDPAKLAQVQQEVDQATSSSCPQDRQRMLTILRMTSLAEAMR
jgi:hypothetical protein